MTFFTHNHWSQRCI